MSKYSSGYGCSARDCTSIQQFAWDASFHNATVAIPNPKTAGIGEMEWEYYVSKLHFGYPRATAEDLEVIKEIVSRI